MRPRKRILLLGASEAGLSVRKHVLEVRGYRALTAATADEARDAFDRGAIHLVIAEIGSRPHAYAKLLAELQEGDPLVMVLLTSKVFYSATFEHQAHGFCGCGTSGIDFIEQVRILTMRKRGPKPVQQCAEPVRRSA